MQNYSKLYLAVLDSVPDFMVPTLVAHSILNAHIKFSDNPVYQEWLKSSFRKVVLRVSEKEFQKIMQMQCHIGYESTVLGGRPSCAIPLPVMHNNIPNVLKFAKAWKPEPSLLERELALDELTRISQELGLYDEPEFQKSKKSSAGTT